MSSAAISVLQDRINAQAFPTGPGSNLEPMTAAALKVRLAAGSSRSMRAAMVACSVAGTLDLASIGLSTRKRRGSPRSTPRSANSRTISSAKNGLPAARSAIMVANPPTEGSRPEQLGDQCCGLRIAQRRKGDGLSTGHPAQRAPIFGAVGDQHQRGVCGITATKSAIMDSLTSSIQCASSTT